MPPLAGQKDLSLPKPIKTPFKKDSTGAF